MLNDNNKLQYHSNNTGNVQKVWATYCCSPSGSRAAYPFGPRGPRQGRKQPCESLAQQSRPICPSHRTSQPVGPKYRPIEPNTCLTDSFKSNISLLIKP